MEDEKKKKKNKKKKNKQTKSAIDNTISVPATSQVEIEVPKINEDFDNRLSRGVGDSANIDQIHASVQDNQNHVSKTTQFENEVPKIDMEMDLGNRLPNGSEGMILKKTVETSPRENDPYTEQPVVVGETSLGLQNERAHISKEASLEDTNIGLQNDNGVHIQKEASLDETNIGLPHDNGVGIQKKDSLDEKFKRLQDENEIHLHRETSLESTLLQLEKEKDSWLLKQDGLNEKIKELQEENEIHLHKEASLEWKLLQLEKEIDDGLHKQAHLEEKFNHLVVRTENLSSKESSLEEKVKQLEMERDSWLKKENLLKNIKRKDDVGTCFSQISTKQTAANLDGNFSRLQKQVMELEESKKYLLHENQRLGETISGLQFQIQNLEERVASTVSSIEMGKVNGLCIKPDPQDIVNNDFQVVEIAEQFGHTDSTSKFTDTTAFTDRIDISKDILIQDEKNIAYDPAEKGTSFIINSLSKSSENASLPVKTIESFEDVAIQSEGEDDKNICPNGNIVISDPDGTDEIVQIPLHENHVMGPSLQPRLYEENTDVPLSDSPLIGAPFRIVSFFARYVSGADLVNKS